MNPLFCPVSGGSNAGESLVPIGLGRSDERQLPISNPEWRKGHYAYCAFCRIFTNGFNTLKAMGQDSAVGCAGPRAGAQTRRFCASFRHLARRTPRTTRASSALTAAELVGNRHKCHNCTLARPRAPLFLHCLRAEDNPRRCGASGSRPMNETSPRKTTLGSSSNSS